MPCALDSMLGSYVNKGKPSAASGWLREASTHASNSERDILLVKLSIHSTYIVS